jgi:eukaryotic-like serine/threonine-protein kinase
MAVAFGAVVGRGAMTKVPSSEISSESRGSQPPIAEGQIVGERYLIGPVIGEGGMGVVCAATHIALDAPVAVKVIRSELRDDPEFVQRFLNEARAAASLKDEHIARVHDVGQLDSGEPYLVMERLDGIELEAFMQQSGPLDESEAVDLVLQVCQGLAEAHAAALVHRDIKPANLFLSRRPDGRHSLKILDFGISKHLLQRSSKRLTDPAKSLGSPWYMSPEQMTDPSRVDQRSDIWSLGVLLFELMTKRHPFDGTLLPEVCAKVLTQAPPALSALQPKVHPQLELVVLRCLEKNAEQRYPSVTALSEALRPFSSQARTPSGLEFAPTQPIDLHANVTERYASSGSLTPTIEPVRRQKERTGRFGFLPLFVIAATACAMWLVWGHPANRHALPGWDVVSRLRIPGDPSLGADPISNEIQTHFGSASPFPVLVQSGRATEADRPSDPASATDLPSPILQTTEGQPEGFAHQPLSQEEIRFRDARYRMWLRDQGLHRLDNGEARDTAPGTSSDRQGVTEDEHDEEGAAQ